MFCGQCGTQIQDGTNFCRVCGARVKNQQPVLQNCDQAPVQSNTVKKEKSMAWYKFLICFSLFVGAISNAAEGLKLLTGQQYNTANNGYGMGYYANYSKIVYSQFPGLGTVDVCIGIACILLGIFCLVVRSALANYEKNGPKFLLFMYGAGGAVTDIYWIWAHIVTNGSIGIFDTIS